MQFVLDLFNDNIGLITFLVGLFAFGVYSKQKWDTKRAIANTILLEIQSAEASLKKVRDYLATSKSIPEDIVLMPNESWSSKRQYFVRDFDHDEWDAIGDFYSKCELYDEAARHNKHSFGKNEEQIRANAHRIVADYANAMVEELISESGKPEDKRKLVDEIKKEYNNKEELFEEIYLSGGLMRPMYSPQKYMDQARLYTDNIQELSHLNIGSKLKKLTRRGWLRNLLHVYSR